MVAIQPIKVNCTKVVSQMTLPWIRVIPSSPSWQSLL